MWPYIAWFALGAAAPTVLQHAKPFAHVAVDKSLKLTQRVHRRIHELREDLQDLMAEASAAVQAQARRAGEGDK